MKTIKLLAVLFLANLAFTSCDDDDHDHTHEEEVITTMTVTLSPNTMGGTDVVLKTQDLDGEGSGAPDVTVSGNLQTGVTYSGSIELLNELEVPADDITLEVEEEDLDHQFFYTVGTGLNVTTSNENLDSEGNKLGTEFTLVAGAVGTGDLTFSLVHEPTKPNTGLADAAGETDIEATFSVTVE